MLAHISSRERLVLTLRFGEDLTQAEIGERIGVSQMQVSRLIRQALARLRAGLAERPAARRSRRPTGSDIAGCAVATSRSQLNAYRLTTVPTLFDASVNVDGDAELRTGQHAREAVQRGQLQDACTSTISTARPRAHLHEALLPADEEEVAFDELVQGYELAPERYVVIEDEELAALAPEFTRTIEIEDFVELEEIDRIYLDQPYHMVPNRGGAKSYHLLLHAMQETGKVAIARVVLRSRERLVAIRPLEDVLLMTTMNFGDEVRDTSELRELRRGADADVASASSTWPAGSCSRSPSRLTSPATTTPIARPCSS